MHGDGGLSRHGAARDGGGGGDEMEGVNECRNEGDFWGGGSDSERNNIPFYEMMHSASTPGGAPPHRPPPGDQ